MNPSNVSIPVIVDAVRIRDNTKWIRCTYFSVESITPELGWTLVAGLEHLPLYLLELSGILYAPFGSQNVQFLTPEDVERTLERIEGVMGLLVQADLLWVPEWVFAERNVFASPNHVVRIGFEIFRELYFLGEGKITETELRESLNKRIDQFYFEESPKETEAFTSWNQREIERAKEQYPKQKQLVLKWRTND